MDKGKLYVVATPIGHLDDITFRAVDVLKKVAFILAEDTRETAKLLQKYSIQTQCVSYRDQNHERMIQKILEKLDMGLDLALVSDCGTPLISDPGYRLVKELREKQYDVLPIPGPSAITSAISVSGLPTDKFLFLGFLPKSDIKRGRMLKEYKESGLTLVIYESPNRLMRLLNQIQNIFGDVTICIARDISKMKEDYIFGKVSSAIDNLKQKNFEDNPHGEYVVMISLKE